MAIKKNPPSDWMLLEFLSSHWLCWILPHQWNKIQKLFKSLFTTRHDIINETEQNDEDYLQTCQNVHPKEAPKSQTNLNTFSSAKDNDDKEIETNLENTTSPDDAKHPTENSYSLNNPTERLATSLPNAKSVNRYSEIKQVNECGYFLLAIFIWWKCVDVNVKSF